MRLNSKLTWGLAWAGLAIVIAVPSADFFTSKSGKAAVITSTIEPGTPVKVASVTTTVTPTGIKITPSAPGDAVSSYLQTGKSLPNYISDSSAPAAAPAASSEESTQVATIDPQQIVAPVPLPGRPPQLDAQPQAEPAPQAQTASTTASTQAPYITPPPAAPVLDESSYDQEQQTAEAPTGPVPPEPIDDGSADAPNGNLQHYLDRNGLLDNGPPDDGSTAQVTVTDQGNSDYDPQGFYLSDGPNSPRAAMRRRRIERLLDGGDAPDFTLF